jgi:DNA-binding CsgD family transcriptional regulator
MFNHSDPFDYASKEIAQRLAISAETVKVHRKHL